MERKKQKERKKKTANEATTKRTKRDGRNDGPATASRAIRQATVDISKPKVTTRKAVKKAVKKGVSTAKRVVAKKRNAPGKKPVAAMKVEVVKNFEEALRSPLRDARHERFCQALLVERSATAAALKAGYPAAGARQQASRLLTYVDIQRRLAGLLEIAARQKVLRKRDVLSNASQRAAAAMVDIADLVGLPWDDFCIAIKTHPAGRAIKKVKRGIAYDAASKTFGPAYVQEIELFDPRGSERLLADLLGWEAPKQVALSAAGPSRVIAIPEQRTVEIAGLPEGNKDNQIK
jgi:hypothetical protein